MELLPLLTVVRLVVPLAILRFPLLGITLGIVIDMYDYLFMTITIPSKEYYFYQKWDKTMDLYMFSLVFYTSLSWKDRIAKKLSVFAFSLRALGDMIFFATGFQAILLLTPNIFETLTLMYLFFKKLTGKQIMYASNSIIVVVLVAVLVPKVIHEYLLHVMRLQPWDVFSFGDFFKTTGVINDYIDYALWGGIIHFLQTLVVLYHIIKNRR